MPTDDGIVRVEPDQGKIVETKRFPDTEPFVEADSRLLFAADGIYVVGRTQITKLVIK